MAAKESIIWYPKKKDFSTLRIKNDLPNLATLYIRGMKVGMKKTQCIFVLRKGNIILILF